MHVGSRITFGSKNSKDNVIWRGVVKGIIDYTIAKMHGDIVSYQGAVLQTDAGIPALEDCTFFLYELDEAPSGTNKLRVFANEWITPGSLEIIANTVRVNIVVYDINTNNHTNILDVLKQNGYDNCRILNVVE
jgi:hypothetical protein